MTWTVDPTHTHVGFSVRHMMVTTVRGQFKTYRGTLALDTADFAKSLVRGRDRRGEHRHGRHRP